jgi:hypothetical protein
MNMENSTSILTKILVLKDELETDLDLPLMINIKIKLKLMIFCKILL